MRAKVSRLLVAGLPVSRCAWAKECSCSAGDFSTVVMDVVVDASNKFAAEVLEFEVGVNMEVDGGSSGHDQSDWHPSKHPTTTFATSTLSSTNTATLPQSSPPDTISTPVLTTSTPPSYSSAPTPSSITTTNATTPSTPTVSATGTTTSNPKPSSSSSSGFCYGVNLGGWLLLEPWMLPDVFSGDFSSAVDQWTFDSIPGAEAALQNHWSTYITQDTIKAVAATGINCLRIPMGFWAYDNANTDYKLGADAYLEQAIEWARAENVRVWIDCHGSPGSQNGLEHSGHVTEVEWQQPENLQRSIDVLTTIATKYGGTNYSGVVSGIELTNEPSTAGNNQFSTTQSWTKQAFHTLKDVIKNDALQIIMHDAWMGPSNWETLGSSLGPRFALDVHEYQNQIDSDKSLTQDQHIAKACGWAAALADGKEKMPLYVGEWTAGTEICVNPDGSTTAGTTCEIQGCQCQSASMDEWNDNMVQQLRAYTEAQMQVFERSTDGYFMWSVYGPGSWGFLKGIERGTIPNPVTKYQNSNRCGGR